MIMPTKAIETNGVKVREILETWVEAQVLGFWWN
jgi:hypothetical protein